MRDMNFRFSLLLANMHSMNIKRLCNFIRSPSFFDLQIKYIGIRDSPNSSGNFC